MISPASKRYERSQRCQDGFTLIELMTVMAVLSILLLIAMTAYQDYVVRSQISEGINLAAGHKSGVLQTFYTSGVLPGTNDEAGVAPAQDFETDFVSSIGISSEPRGGTITITYKIPKLGADNLLQLVPTNNNGQLEWTCRPADTNGVQIDLLPGNCRGS